MIDDFVAKKVSNHHHIMNIEEKDYAGDQKLFIRKVSSYTPLSIIKKYPSFPWNRSILSSNDDINVDFIIDDMERGQYSPMTGDWDINKFCRCFVHRIPTDIECFHQVQIYLI